jgi:hypothetical protein
MSPFTVEWDPDAETELARIWLAAADPDEVTQAQARIDQLLARNPSGHGQPLSEGLWRIEVPPLVVNYTIGDANKHVQVTWVRRAD